MENLKNVQDELQEKGVTDVKFLFGKTSEKPASEVKNLAAKLLRQVLDGKKTRLKSIEEAQ